ncbi:hypothetical protein [Brevundimonas albigilva]|uniref:Uncharacterized protein n=1 Tax=Brevundimonas albigilva TaxID=1312364 RepID=A0ABY4SLX7_9CAUL|nr:hypothetical protein [Brevundimonas albigilva]URI15926.1 hypothetical protein M8231_02740 [Brevundimonas albigilva]
MSQWDGTMPHNSQETVVVPREPTEEMLNAAAVLLSRNALPKNWPGLHKIYRAMIAAAPASPDPLLEEAVGHIKRLCDWIEYETGGELPYEEGEEDADAFLAKLGRA